MDSDGALTMDQTQGVQKIKKGISGSTLKLIAIITMLIDHTAATILDRTLMARGGNQLNPNNIEEVVKFYTDNGVIIAANMTMRLIGRLAFPIFCFLLIEGFIHTRNVWKYAARLALFALISEIPFDLAFKGKVLEFTYQNVFFTLFIGLIVMMGFRFVKEKLDDKKWLPAVGIAGAVGLGIVLTGIYSNILAFIQGILNGLQNGTATVSESSLQSLLVPGIIFVVIAIIIFFLISKKKTLQKTSVIFTDLLVLCLGMVVAELLSTDYSALGILTIAVMYWLRKSPVKAMLGGCITLTVLNFAEITAFFDWLLIRRYNGTRGLNLKYVFYIFYPGHLLILYLICYFMGIA